VDVVYADAAGLPELDQIEADAITSVFGARKVPVTAPKTMTGRLSAGAGPVDVVAALLSIRDGVIPPTMNVTLAAGYELDLVTDRPRPAALRTALVLARGHFGFNSALLLRAVT
jgi:act minimal PKS chain-length factor (CLF/KS beta)